MARYINENEAREQIKEITSEHTNDFAIHIRKRVTKATALITVTFALGLIYKEENEHLYRLFIKKHIDGVSELRVISSDTFLENQSKKEYFFIEADIEV